MLVLELLCSPEVGKMDKEKATEKGREVSKITPNLFFFLKKGNTDSIQTFNL